MATTWASISSQGYAEFFQKPYPVRATVVVKELIAEGLRIEITATAVI